MAAVKLIAKECVQGMAQNLRKTALMLERLSEEIDSASPTRMVVEPSRALEIVSGLSVQVNDMNTLLKMLHERLFGPPIDLLQEDDGGLSTLLEEPRPKRPLENADEPPAKKNKL